MNTEIKKIFVSLEVAKLMDEKQFNGECLAYYDEHGELYLFDKPLKNSSMLRGFTAATVNQCLNWLRDKHKTLITIELLRFAYDSEKDNIHCPDNIFKYKIIKLDSWFSHYIENTHQIYDYNLSANKAILEALNLIKFK